MTNAKAPDDAELAERYERQKSHAARLQRQIAASGKEIGELPAVFDPDRKAACAYDLKLFLESYCEEAVRLGWSADHLELIEYLQDVLLYSGQLAVGMPRGTGKTTIVTLALLWAVLYGHHHFIVLIAANDGKAVKALKGLKTQVEVNQTLAEDFPEVCFPVKSLQGTVNRQAGQTCLGVNTSMSWGKEELVFPTIEGSASSGALIMVGGITGAVARGPQHTLETGEIIRPSAVLLDDFQTRESAKSLTQTKDRLDIIEADIAGMAGPDRGLSMLATVTVIYPDDGADQLLDHDLFPDWAGIRKKFLISFPTNMALWEEYKEIRRQSLRTYRDIRMATRFYEENQEAMNEGAEVSWDARFRRVVKEVDGEEIDVKEVSAIQHAMEWFLIKPEAFASELQNEPLEPQDNEKGWLKAKQIESKTNSQPRDVIPQLLMQTEKVVEHIDVHDDLLYWARGAVSEDGATQLANYDTWPKQRMRYFQKKEARKTMQTVYKRLGREGAIRKSLFDLASEHLDASFLGEDGESHFKVDLLLIDRGHESEIVASVVNELLRDPANRTRVMMCQGFGVKATETPINERKHPPKTKVGNNCYRPLLKDKLDAPRLNVNTNYWKEATNDRWATGFGVPGCLSLFKGGDHQGFSEHQKGEIGTPVEAKGRRVWEFKQLPTDNHWYDNTVNLLAGASFIGCDTPANKQTQPKRRKKRRRKREGMLG